MEAARARHEVAGVSLKLQVKKCFVGILHTYSWASKRPLTKRAAGAECAVTGYQSSL